MTPAAEMLAQAMIGDNRVLGLRDAIIQRLSLDGISREAVLGDLDDLREGLSQAGQFDEEEVVLTVMDHLVGWCSPQWSLANVGTSEDEDLLLESE